MRDLWVLFAKIYSTWNEVSSAKSYTEIKRGAAAASLLAISIAGLALRIYPSSSLVMPSAYLRVASPLRRRRHADLHATPYQRQRGWQLTAAARSLSEKVIDILYVQATAVLDRRLPLGRTTTAIYIPDQFDTNLSIQWC